MIILYILIALIALLLMVTIHEFGHYIAGKIFKFKINEFSIGFGKKLYSKKLKNGEVFSIRLFPLGGYCAFEGENGQTNEKNNNINPFDELKVENENKQIKTYKAFTDEKPYKRIIVLSAGVIFNFISAILFSFLFIIIVGYQTPSVDKITASATEITQTHVDRLKAGDEIIAVNGKKIDIINTYASLLSKYTVGNDVKLTVLRNNNTIDLTLTLANIKTDNGTIIGFGFASKYITHKVGFFKSLLLSIPKTLNFSVQILVVLFKLLIGKIGLNQLSGPIGTVSLMADYMKYNFQNLFVLLPLLSANMALFNVLPIPALDGSRILFTSIEWIRGKPINRNVENYIHLIGFVILLMFVVSVDLIHFMV